MGQLIHLITQLGDAKYGVNILEEAPPGGVQGVGTNIVAAVADLPWGPTGEITWVTSNAQLFEAFAPLPFDVLNSYPALRAFINKTFPNGVKVARIAATDAEAATLTFDDAVPGDSVVATARYPGAVGNQIRVQWVANADDANARDAIVTIGTKYSATYLAVCTTTGGLSLTDPGDPYVGFALAGGATGVPAAVAATALAGGSDGTPVAGDYTDAVDLFAGASVVFHVGFVAEPPSALLNAINAHLKTFVDTHKKGMWVLGTVAAQAKGDAITYVGTYRADRLVYPWPLVKTTNAYDPNRAEITVNGNSFAAVAMGGVAPEVSPGGAPGAPFLRGITGLESGISATLLDLNQLNDAGIAPWFINDALEGAIIHKGVTTTLTAGLTKISRRRMTDYLTQSIAGFLARYQSQPLDLDLASRNLGPVTGPEMAQIRAYLKDLEDLGRIAASSLDEFGGNTQSNLDNDQWIIILLCKLIGSQDEIVLRAQIGETVTVEAA